MKAYTLPKFSVKVAAAVALSAVSLLLASCFYMPGVGGKPAKAGLSINRSLLPSNVSSIAVIVGGPGMNPIVAQYPVGTTSATLSVPSGAARTFTVLANTPSVTFEDAVTVDLAPDEAKEIDLAPKLFASQILVPDPLNNRLVQISDMQGAGWTTLPPSSPPYLYPYDVDFDDQGRIYVANGDGVSDGITRMDDITGANTTPVTGTVRTIQSIAMDRAHGILYYVGYDAQGLYNLWKIQITPTTIGTETAIDLSTAVGAFYSRGIAVDSDGFVYMATTSPTVAILKIDPNKPQVVNSYTGSLQSPWDVLVNGDFIYVSDNLAQSIVRLSKDFSSAETLSGPFVGPERFVAILNKPITVVDEEQSSSLNIVDRLVSFGDMTGAGLTTYGSTGTATQGPGYFQFFNSFAS